MAVLAGWVPAQRSAASQEQPGQSDPSRAAGRDPCRLRAGRSVAGRRWQDREGPANSNRFAVPGSAGSNKPRSVAVINTAAAATGEVKTMSSAKWLSTRWSWAFPPEPSWRQTPVPPRYPWPKLCRQAAEEVGAIAPVAVMIPDRVKFPANSACKLTQERIMPSRSPAPGAPGLHRCWASAAAGPPPLRGRRRHAVDAPSRSPAPGAPGLHRCWASAAAGPPPLRGRRRHAVDAPSRSPAPGAPGLHRCRASAAAGLHRYAVEAATRSRPPLGRRRYAVDTAAASAMSSSKPAMMPWLSTRMSGTPSKSALMPKFSWSR